jgi:hypothetical protein
MVHRKRAQIISHCEFSNFTYIVIHLDMMYISIVYESNKVKTTYNSEWREYIFAIYFNYFVHTCILLSYDPNSVSQEKGRLLTERSGAPSPVGLGRTVRVINTR